MKSFINSNPFYPNGGAGIIELQNLKVFQVFESQSVPLAKRLEKGYGFGYNTQERVPEIQKDHYAASYWEYDPRVVMCWNTDPKPTTSFSSYAIMQGNPIWFSDHLGDSVIYEERSSNSWRSKGMAIRS